VSKEYIKKDLYSPQDKKRNFKNIRKLYDLSFKSEYTIDEQTFEDLNMNEVFTKLDRTYSTAGEEALYSMLRNPMMEEEKLNRRSELIDTFSNDVDLAVDIRHILFNMTLDKKNHLINMLHTLKEESKLKYYLYTFLGKVVPITSILLAIILKDHRFVLLLSIAVFINLAINHKEENNINGTGLKYITELIVSAKKISKIKNEKIKNYTENMRNILNDLKVIDRGTATIKLIRVGGGLLELITIPFLIEEATYYKTSREIKLNEGKILQLFYLVGEIDALIAIFSVKVSNKGAWTTPTFTEETYLEIKNGTHPLIKKPVPNSIILKGKGMVLTGTNMSGKSTFLRMVGTNILLAQTFNFVFASKYKASFLNIVTSISPSDDINNGKSNYLAEAEAILRIINSLEKDIPVFCLIDEIFRGTNPIERIASSAEILEYINERDAITVVATHDREITEILKDKVDFYYFSEDVNGDKGLVFDYKLKEGISKTKNAIRLLEYIGYPKEITNKAYKRTEVLEKYL
jgi:DNA mismatch repair ATPase MutS